MKWFLILLFTLNPFVTSEAKIYQIEMIIFSQPTFQNNNLKECLTSTSLDPNFFYAKKIKPLPTSQFLLKNEQTELDKNLEYQTLLHLAWQQSITHLSTRPIRIEGDKVQGLFRANVQHYFNISISLLFNQSSGSGSWYESQERRMRSNQLNYLDFLYYGVLIKIIPLT